MTNWVPRCLFRLEDDDAERRQRHATARRLAVRCFVLGLDPPAVTDVAAPEHGGVAVKNLPVSAQARKTDPVARPRHRCEVAAEDQKVLAILRVAREADHAGL